MQAGGATRCAVCRNGRARSGLFILSLLRGYIFVQRYQRERRRPWSESTQPHHRGGHGLENAAPAVAFPGAAGGDTGRGCLSGRPLMDQVTLRWFSRDLNSRGLLVANALSDSVADAMAAQKPQRLRALLDRAAQDERLFALGLCSPQGRLLVSTDRFPESLACADALLRGGGADSRLGLAGGTVHVGVQDILGSARPSAGCCADHRTGGGAARGARRFRRERRLPPHPRRPCWWPAWCCCTT